LWTAGIAPIAGPIRFHTRSGVLTAARDGELIRLDFPTTPAIKCDPPPAALLDALGVEPVFVGKTIFDKFLVVESADTIRSLRPSFRQLAEIPNRGVIVTSRSDDPRFDFISRYFAPAAGIDEDPVTGSAHCCLGPYWSQQLGKSELTGFQASARGGIVHVRVSGDRVILGGQAILVMKGELL
jgi:predicted PhzF superfamily epimerase YddE/YHI9